MFNFKCLILLISINMMFSALGLGKHHDNNPSLGMQSGLTGGFMITAMAILWNLPEEASQWYDKPHPSPQGFYRRWRKNIASGPIWDQDVRLFNAYGHIHVGAMYNVMCLEHDYSQKNCFIYANMMSLAWEFGPEAITEIPSWQDILMTGPVGALVGDHLYYWKKRIRANNDVVLGSKIIGRSLKFIIDPIGYISRGFSDIERNKLVSGYTYDIFSSSFGFYLLVSLN